MVLSALIEAAAPFGGAIAVVMVVLAVLARGMRDRSRERRDAIARADPSTLPAILGDEIDKLGLSANELSREQRFHLVSETLVQREKRNQRLFVFSLFLASLIALVTVIGFVRRNDSVPPENGNAIVSASLDVPEGWSLEEALNGYAKSVGRGLVVQPGCENLVKREMPVGPARAQDDTLLLNTLLMKAGLRRSEAWATSLPGGGYEIRC